MRVNEHSNIYGMNGVTSLGHLRIIATSVERQASESSLSRSIELS